MDSFAFTKTEIDNVIKFQEFTFDDLYYLLGEGVLFEYVPENTYFDAPKKKNGERLWKALDSELYEKICNGNEPKEWVKDLISGDIRDLISGILTMICTTYSVSLGIAIPTAALLMKNGISNYCKNVKHQGKDTLSVASLLKEHQDYAEMTGLGYEDKFKKLTKRKKE
jgi:hypothetical protein